MKAFILNKTNLPKSKLKIKWKISDEILDGHNMVSLTSNCHSLPNNIQKYINIKIEEGKNLNNGYVGPLLKIYDAKINVSINADTYSVTPESLLDYMDYFERV